MTEFQVVRSTTIDADPALVRALVDDFHAWPRWSPWEDLDPDVKREYSGPETGVGAGYAWEGNRKAGKGRMRITSSTPERVVIDLTFEKPWKASNTVIFEFAPAPTASGTGTGVSWRMKGENTGLARLFAAVFSMDRMLGKDFEKGLARLKATAESGA